MSIKQFRALVAIVEHGSFAAAADNLCLTHSAVSMQINGLEEALQVSLFDRTRRPPQLTEAGRVAYRQAKRILHQYQRIFDELGGTIDLEQPFNLGVIPTSLTGLLPRLLILLREQSPNLIVSVISGLSGALVREVESGRLDGAIISDPQGWDLSDDLDWCSIGEQHVVVIAPPESAADTLEALFATTPYIRFNRRAWIAPAIEDRLKSLGLSLNAQAEIESIEAIHLMVSKGFGASIIPDTRSLVPLGLPLRVMEFGPVPMYRAVGLLSRRDSLRKPALESLKMAANLAFNEEA